MLPWPPDEYDGPFPPPDPRLPRLAQAHESAVEGFRRADETQQMQHHAMASYAAKNEPLQTIHEQRLGIQGGPDGGMRPGAPVTMEFHEVDEEPPAQSWEDSPALGPRSPFTRNPFYRGHHHLIPGLVAHGGGMAPIRRGQVEGQMGRYADLPEDDPGRMVIEQDTPEPPARRGVVPRTGSSARAGWNHMRPVGETLGEFGAAGAVGLGYLGGGAASLGWNALRGGWNWMTSREPREEPEPPEPPPPAPRPPVPREETPAQPVPVFLMDLEERMRAARQGHNLGQGRFVNGEIDRRHREREIQRTGYGFGRS